MPELDEASLPACAAANHAVLGVVLDRLRSGSLDPGVPPIQPGVVIGAGQSMGGHIALLMQVNHDSFDGLAMLGASVTRTRLQSAIAGQDVCFAGKPVMSEIIAGLSSIDLSFAFHWDDVPEHFAKVDMDSKNGIGPVPYWGSALTPDASTGVFAGYFTGTAAQVTVPTLVAMGERDVCQDPLRELAAFMSARDLAQFVVPRMAHMHNFAGTRELLWRRLDAFISQVANRGY
jgi:pimeloyl-ACP methyl ester carboxylesterase